MSYDEVERGLPPINIEGTPTWLRRMRGSPGSSKPFDSNPADTETGSNFSSESCPGAIPNHNHRESLDEPPSHRPPTPPLISRQPPPTKRYVIRDEDNEMRVFKVAEEDSGTGTLRNNPIPNPNKFYISGSAERSQRQNLPPPGSSRIVVTGIRIFSVILCVVPAILFSLALNFMVFKMIQYPSHITGLCIFQSVFWPCLLVSLVHRLGFGMPIFQSFSCSNDGWKNWVDIMVTTIFSTGAILLQVMALMYLDITIALSIMFAPLVVVALIRYINRERLFPIELCFTSLMAYLGLTLIAIPSLTAEDRNYQRQLLLGLGASIGSMMLTIPACLVLERLRYNKVDDCITGTGVGLLGTFICVIMGIILGFTPEPQQIEATPEEISAVVCFTVFGMFFLFLEARLRARLQTQRGQTPISSIRAVYIGRTRIGVFIYCAIWEVCKRIIEPEAFTSPSTFSIIGVILIMLSYILTVGFESWVDRMKSASAAGDRQNGPTAPGRRLFHFLPWLIFSRK